MLAMLTGCFALGEASEGLRAFHMLSVELLMMYFPFSRLMHAFTFIFSRYFMGAAYGKRGYVP
jgi:nitrate reductase gamma subunit